MLYAECFITPAATIYRKRVLPVPGQVLCGYGDQVASDRVLAEVDMAMGYHLLDLEYELHTEVDEPDRFLIKKVGDLVEQGEVIARRGRILPRECVSPVKGRLIDARRGKILIETMPEHVQLRAFYPGKVVNVIPERGATLEITAALVQGLWGTGRELRGRLDNAVPNGQTPLRGEQIGVSHMGTVLIGGRSLDQRAIEAAVRNQVAAIVVGSVSSALLPAIQESGLSVVATEGFGDWPMSDRAYQLLQANVGHETCISPAIQPRWEVRRPEVVIPLTTEVQPPALKAGTQIEIGTTVRAMRAPYENLVGQVASLPAGPRRLASDARVRGAVVDLQTVGRVFVPFTNLEILR
ncbi:MAG: hypothetical protein ACK2VD_12690 [Anaerolineae bacterium]|jgi:hypothetical protein